MAYILNSALSYSSAFLYFIRDIRHPLQAAFLPL
jgi:hypothetical protein